jgi:hypothetical protein
VRSSRGAARVADAKELDAVEWAPISNLDGFAPGGFYPAVQEYLDAAIAARQQEPS